MDPITHGLIGAAAGLGVVTFRREATARERWLAALCGLVGGEAPDADRGIDRWFAHQWEDGGGLAYMLYHRGITHSVLACLVFAALIGGGALHFMKVKKPWPFLAALVGVSLHLAMDATNDYGVHPFYPLSNQWFYGDFLFLGEPLVSAPLLPFLAIALGLPSRHVPWVCGLFGLAWFGFGVGSHWLSGWGFAVAFAWLVLHIAIQRKFPRATPAWAGCALAIGLFWGCAQMARARGEDAIAGDGQTSRDVITTPQGANPLCFRLITVARSGDRFDVRLGVTSLLPELVDPGSCFTPKESSVPQSVCLEEPELKPADPTHWLASFTGSISQFEAWAAQSPRVNATRHFLRAPFWGPDARVTNCKTNGAHAGGPKVVIGDMRVDYEKECLDHFCKYAFLRCNGDLPCPTEPLDPILPLGDPPFFKP
jgi:inner membrane protein